MAFLHRRQLITTTAGAATALAVPSLSLAGGSATRIPTVAEIRRSKRDFWILADLINDYRREIGLPAARMSARLTAVAAVHAKDLCYRRPHDIYGSLHSWSPSKYWQGGGYDYGNKDTWPLMWNKPKEITGYPGFGFEISAAGVRDAAHALQVWRESESHHNVIANRHVWNDPRWQWHALGAVFYKGYACAWFGDKEDV